MANDTDLATEYADSMRKSIERVMTAVSQDLPIEDEDAYDHLNEWPLEIVDRRGARFTVVLTVGGPYAAVEADLDADGDRQGDARLVVSWGSGEVVRRSTSINSLLDHFAEICKDNDPEIRVGF